MYYAIQFSATSIVRSINKYFDRLSHDVLPACASIPSFQKPLEILV